MEGKRLKIFFNLHLNLQTSEILVLSTTQNLANFYVQLLFCNEKLKNWPSQNCNGAGPPINPWTALGHRIRHGKFQRKRRNSGLKKKQKKRQAGAGTGAGAGSGAGADLLQELLTQRIVSLSSNTKFTRGQSPIQINADVFVPAGITLEIENGVELRFGAGRKLTVQGKIPRRFD